jgi:hypothetical protein
MTWKVKRGQDEYPCPDTPTLKQWASQGLIAVDDYIFNPVLNQWLYARDVAEIQGVFGKQVKAEKAKTAQNAAIGFAIVGVLFLLIAPPLGVLCFIAAVVSAVIHHVQAGTVV